MTGHIRDHDAVPARVGVPRRLSTALGRRVHRAHESMFGLAGHAGWYDKAAARLARPLYRRIAADVAGAALPHGAFVLDIGTGPGRLPLLIARRCPSLVVEGIDLSEQMVARAQANAAREPIPGRQVSFRMADVRALPYPDDSIDLVVSSLSLHHWTDVPAGLAEIQRVLRPEGRAWIYDVRPVLRHVAANAPRRDLPVALDTFEPWPGRDIPARVWAIIAPSFINRLTMSSSSEGVTPSVGGATPE